MKTQDMIRELEKILDALTWADLHFDAEASMNAALHLNATVRPAPLASEIASAKQGVERLLADLRAAP